MHAGQWYLHHGQQGLHPFRQLPKLLLRVHASLAVLKCVAIVLDSPLGEAAPRLAINVLQECLLLF